MAFSEMYSISWTGTITASGGDTDLWEFLTSTERPLLIRMIRLGQISEVATVAEEGLRVSVIRMGSSITGGNPGNPGNEENLGEAAGNLGASQAVNNDTVATTTGNLEILDEIGWINRQSPLEVWYRDIRFAPRAFGVNTGLFIRLQTTLADDMTFVGNVIVEEINSL